MYTSGCKLESWVSSCIATPFGEHRWRAVRGAAVFDDFAIKSLVGTQEEIPTFQSSSNISAQMSHFRVPYQWLSVIKVDI